MTARLKWVAILFLLLGSAWLVLALWQSRVRNLLEQATYITSINPAFQWCYVWSSPQDVLLLQANSYNVPCTGVPITGSFTGASLWPCYHAANYNIITRQTQPLDALSQAVGDLSLQYVAESVSPDGKWLLCRSELVSSTTYKAFSLDGRQHLIWPAPKYSFKAGPVLADSLHPWLADSRHWILEYHPGSSGLVISFASTYTAKQKTVQTDAQIPGADHAFCLGLSHDNHLLIRGDNPPADSNTTQARVAVYDVELSPAASVQHTDVLLPAGADNVWDVLSPRGDRIIWLLDVDPEKAQLSWLRRVRHWLRLSPSTPYSSLWISNRGSTKMHMIGMLSSYPGQNLREILTNPQWTPDGKSVSFISHDALYTVPAD